MKRGGVLGTKRRSPYVLIALIGISTLGLAGCGGGGGPGGARGTLVIGEVAAPTSFAADAAGNEPLFDQAVYDTLLQYSDTGVLEPDLATSWSYNAAKTVLTMTLRTGVTFTDGSPFNAQVAAENLTRFKSGTSPFASDLKNMVSATASAPNTLVVTLSQPDPALLLYLTQQAGYMESARAYANQNLATDPVGSGPYRLDSSSTVVGSAYVFTKNPTYWNKSEQHYNEVEIKVLPDPTALLDAIRAGQVDVADVQLLATQVDQVKTVPGWTLIPINLNWAGILLFDRDGKIDKPLGNVLVRQALNYALNRRYLLQATGAGHGTITSSIIPPGAQGYDPKLNSYYTYDPTKAKQLLAQAGYGSSATITLLNIPPLQQANNLISQELGAVGIKVKLDNVALTQTVSAIDSGKVPATEFALNNSASAWVNVQTSIAPDATWNPLHTSTPKLNSLISQLQTASGRQAETIAREINEYLVQQAWDVPLSFSTSYFAADNSTNATISPGINYPTPDLWDITPKG